MIINFNNINYTPEEFRNFFLNDYDSIPNKIGTREKERYDRTLDRTLFFRDKHNLPQHKRQLLDIIKLIRNDTPDLFFTKGLFFFKWKLNTTLRFYNDNLYDIDSQGDNIIISNVCNNIGDNGNIINKIYQHYNINKVIIYLIGLTNYKGEIEPQKKVGFTVDINLRLNQIITNNPNEPFVLKTWEVKFKDKHKIETYIHTCIKE